MQGWNSLQVCFKLGIYLELTEKINALGVLDNLNYYLKCNNGDTLRESKKVRKNVIITMRIHIHEHSLLEK